MGFRTSAAALGLTLSLTGAACAREEARNPLCDLGPLESSLVAVTDPAAALPSAGEIGTLDAYVAAALAADPSLAVEAGAAAAALARLDDVVARSGGNPGTVADAKASLRDAARQLRTLSDAIEARTAEGCPVD